MTTLIESAEAEKIPPRIKLWASEAETAQRMNCLLMASGVLDWVKEQQEDDTTTVIIETTIRSIQEVHAGMKLRILDDKWI